MESWQTQRQQSGFQICKFRISRALTRKTTQDPFPPAWQHVILNTIYRDAHDYKCVSITTMDKELQVTK